MKNNHRITFRFNDNVKNSLDSYKLILRKRGINMSNNELIKTLILSKSNGIHLSSKDINKIKNSYSSADYKKLAINTSKLFNAINDLNRKIDGADNNINQITRMLHRMAYVNDTQEFNHFMAMIGNYKKTIKDTKNAVKGLEKGAIKQWQRM